MSLQQSENSAMWHGPGSRTMSAVPANTYYGFQGQNQQSSGFRQAQQPLQNHGSLGYPNFYHSQAGISLEHQQQNPRDGSLGGGFKASQSSFNSYGKVAATNLLLPPSFLESCNECESGYRVLLWKQLECTINWMLTCASRLYFTCLSSVKCNVGCELTSC